MLEYVNVDRDIETGEMLDLVSEPRSADNVSDDDDVDGPEEPPVTRSDARKGLAQVISFFEQNPSLSDHLDHLWKAMRAMDTCSGPSVLKTMLDFFKK